MRTIWVLGDQLNRDLGALRTATPADARVLLVESDAKLTSKRWHRQRAHLVLSGMRHLTEELRAEGFEVDHRRARSLRAGLADHRHEHRPERVEAMEPASFDGLAMLRSEGVELVRSEQFLCHYEHFAEWAAGRKSLKMEDFYRWQRRRLGYLMDGDEPCGGRWNFDADNRKPPPRGEHAWPTPPVDEPDELDVAASSDVDTRADVWGQPATGLWATTRTRALDRLQHVIEHVLPHFGPHEDAMLSTNWHLAHTLLSPYLNLGLLAPEEVCDAVDDAYRSGGVPIASAEGLIRQLIGWREYVWGVYWLWMPEYRKENILEAHRPLPPVFTSGETDMACVSHVLNDVDRNGWTHHIQRLMILGNLSLLAGVRPHELTDWMWAGFVDGADWVMQPNVIGMALHADGGRMATKPYAAGGAYIDRMSDYCGDCRYDRKRRTGEDACPFTTLYWDFLDRHADTFESNHRMAQPVRGLRRLGDLDDVRARAREVLAMLDAGEL